MKTNLYKAMGNKGAITIRLYTRWLFHVIVLLFSVSVLVACKPKSPEQQIASINRYIAPDGHLTKTHLYIHWPAEYTKPRRNDPGGKEIVPALTLKIPVEYLGQNLISFANGKKIFLHDKLGVPMEETPTEIDYRSLINEALSIHDRQITMVYLRFQPGAKPYVPMIPYEDDPPELAQKKMENFLSSYAVHIERDVFFAVALDDRRLGVSPYEKLPEFGCMGEDSCHVHFGIKGRFAVINGIGESLIPPKLARLDKNNPLAPEPPSNGLPKWHVKLDPTQALLNSFILPEDSPEIKGMFTLNK